MCSLGHTVLTPSDYRVMPWKNGGGTTREIAVFPDAVDLDDEGRYEIGEGETLRFDRGARAPTHAVLWSSGATPAVAIALQIAVPEDAGRDPSTHAGTTGLA